MTLQGNALAEAERLSLVRVMRVLRDASDSGNRTAAKADVVRSAAAVQTGGRTVMSMDFYKARGGSAVALPQAFFGRPSLTCSAQSAGGKGAVNVEKIKAALAAEGINATPFAIKAAHKVGSDYVRNLEKLLKHDYPRSKSWTAAQVKKSAA